VKPRIMEWWLDDCVEFFKDVFGDGRLEPLHIIAFREDQAHEASDYLMRIAGERLSPDTVKHIVLGNSAVYLPEYRLVAVPVFILGGIPIVFWYTEAFHHEVTHHVMHNTGALRGLGERLLDLLPTARKILEDPELGPRWGAYYMHWVDELFAHYTEFCYLKLLKKEPCDPTEWFGRCTSLIYARMGASSQARHHATRIATEFMEAERSPEVWKVLHEVFDEVTERFPADVYGKYLEVDLRG